VNIVDVGSALVYVPGQDPVPTGSGWPSNLGTATSSLNTDGGGMGE